MNLISVAIPMIMFLVIIVIAVGTITTITLTNSGIITSIAIIVNMTCISLNIHASRNHHDGLQKTH